MLKVIEFIRVMNAPSVFERKDLKEILVERTNGMRTRFNLQDMYRPGRKGRGDTVVRAIVEQI